MDPTVRVRMCMRQIEAAPLGELREGSEYDLPEELARRWLGLGIAVQVPVRPPTMPLHTTVGESGETTPAPEASAPSATGDAGEATERTPQQRRGRQR